MPLTLTLPPNRHSLNILATADSTFAFVNPWSELLAGDDESEPLLVVFLQDIKTIIIRDMKSRESDFFIWLLVVKRLGCLLQHG